MTKDRRGYFRSKEIIESIGRKLTMSKATRGPGDVPLDLTTTVTIDEFTMGKGQQRHSSRLKEDRIKDWQNHADGERPHGFLNQRSGTVLI